MNTFAVIMGVLSVPFGVAVVENFIVN